MMDDGNKLPPLAMVLLGSFFVEVLPPFDQDLEIEIVYGHATSPITRVPIRLDYSKLGGHRPQDQTNRAESVRPILRDLDRTLIIAMVLCGVVH